MTQEHRRYWLVAVAVPLLFFFRTATFDFMQLDDTSHLDFNPYFNPVSVENTFKLWTRPHMVYAPATYTVWAVLAGMSERPAPAKMETGIIKDFRFNPAPFHLVNVLLHAATTGLVFLILLLLFEIPVLALGGSLLFAIHPVQVEPVAWISSLKDTLSVFFIVLSVWLFYLSERPIAHSRRYYWTSVGAGLLAYLSKGSAVVLPAILFLFGTLAMGLPWRALVKKLAPFAALALPITWVTHVTQPTSRMNFEVPTLFQRVWVAMDAIGFYLAKIFFPKDLLLDYGRTPNAALHSSELILTCAVAAGLFAFLFSWKKKGRNMEVLGAGIFLVGLLPTLGLVPFFHQMTSTVTNRYLYLSLFGVAVFACAAFRPYLNHRGWRWGFGVALAILGVIAQGQLSLWKDGVTLLTHNVAKRPHSWLSHNNLGSAYERQGDLANAITHYKIAANLLPSALTYNNLGATAMVHGDLDLAITAFRKGIELSPNTVPNHQGLALSLARQGKVQEAIQTVENALTVAPGAPLLTALLNQLRQESRSTASQPRSP